MADFESIERSSRYVFGETESYYGVWDKRGGTELLERFPLTDEGFEQATARFDKLKRRDRRERGVFLYVLWFVMLAGALAWIMGGLLQAWVFFDPGSFFALAQALSTIGYTVAIGSLVLLGGLILIRRETGRRVAWPKGSAEPGSRLSGWDNLARGILLVTLAVWVVSAAVTRVFFPQPYIFDEPPETGFIVATAVESLAFRIWVAALVILAVTWLRRQATQLGGYEVSE